jgi:putative ABC transport system substrate-binding protein
MHTIYVFSRRAAPVVSLVALMFSAAGTSARAAEPLRTGSNGHVTGQVVSSLPRRIGFLSGGTTEQLLEDFRQGLSDLGYVEGQNIEIDERYAEGRADRLPPLATELVSLPVDVIVAAGAPAAQAARAATETIPIVVVAGDPVGTGLVGGNATGLALGAKGLSAKRLRLLKEAFPEIGRVGYLANMGNPTASLNLRELRDTAQLIGVAVQTLDVRGPDDFDAAFDAAARGNLDGLIVLDDPLTFAYRSRIVEFADANGLLANYDRREWVEAGGLMAYGVNFHAVLHSAAGRVDRLLNGTRPSDLSVDPPTEFAFTVQHPNHQAARPEYPRVDLRPGDRVHRRADMRGVVRSWSTYVNSV